MLSGGESSVPRVPANVAILCRALLVCVVLVIAPTVVAVWAATTITAEDPPKWVTTTDQKGVQEIVDHDNALIDQDLLKPQARGEFGPFVLVGPGDSNESATRERCDTRAAYGLDAQLPLLPLKEILSSPLTIPELSSNVAIAAGCDGVVTMVNGGWLMPNEWGGDEAVDVVVYLVGYLPFRLEWQQATDRTEFGKIDGYPALIEHPIPDLILDFPREAYILFAEPKDGSPGIIFRVGAPSVEKAAEAAISSLEKRIADIGLPPNPYE